MALDFSNLGVVMTANIVLGSAAILGSAVYFLTRRLNQRRATASVVVDPQTSPHILQFPPSRRHTLAGIPQFEKSYRYIEVTPEILNSRALPTDSTPDFNKDNQFTPTGFSTQDIRRLGRFPDYSILSGVPHPEPVSPKFDIRKAVFRPFRPFRWSYHQHMAILKYEPNFWVELEQNYFNTMKARLALFQQHGDRVFFHGPGSDLACRELMEMLFQFVCKRYPRYFSLEKDDTLFVNRLLNTSTDLTTTHPLRAIFEHIPEDYAIMLRNEKDGFYYLRAAMVCSSVGWDIAQHRDTRMHKIHTHVPDASKMTTSIDRYFSRMPADIPIERCSWGLEDWEALFTSPVVMEAQGQEWKRSAFAENPQDLRPEHLKLRCDWQTLRRLPVSAAIVFNFKAIFTPFEEMRDEPFVPALLHRVLDQGKENLISYKCEDHVRKVAMEMLKKWADEQVAQGVVPADWEVGTLEENPFFPGWETKWRHKQGF